MRDRNCVPSAQLTEQSLHVDQLVHTPFTTAAHITSLARHITTFNSFTNNMFVFLRKVRKYYEKQIFEKERTVRVIANIPVQERQHNYAIMMLSSKYASLSHLYITVFAMCIFTSVGKFGHYYMHSVYVFMRAHVLLI